MIDREKVIKSIKACANHPNHDCRSCEYRSANLWCHNDKLIDDFLALLKEQEAKWIHREDLDFKDKLGCIHFHGMCGNCGFIHDFIDGHTGQYLYCPQCGQAVKWDD